MAVTDMGFDEFRANICYSLGLFLVTQDGCFSSRQLIHALVINKFAIEKKDSVSHFLIVKSFPRGPT